MKKLSVIIATCLLTVSTFSGCAWFQGICKEHQFTAWEIMEETHDQLPKRAERSCMICGTTESKIYAYGDLVSGEERCEHEFGAWTVVQEATTEQDGEEKKTCLICGTEETRRVTMIEKTVEKEIVKVPDQEIYPATFSLFQTFGVIGDSYGAGLLNNAEGKDVLHEDFAYAWGTILARMSGNTCYTISAGGMGTQEFFRNPFGLQRLEELPQLDCYIISQGLIDASRGVDFIGTREDIQKKSETFYGNYARIIEAVQKKAPHAVIILTTLPFPQDETLQKLDRAIIEIAEYFDLPCIRLHEDPYYSSSLFMYDLNGHPTTVAYSGMATTIKALIEKSMSEEPRYYKDFGRTIVE